MKKIDPVRFIGNLFFWKDGVCIGGGVCGQGSGSDIDRRTGVFDGSSSEYQTDRCRVGREEMYQAAVTAFRRRMPVFFVPLWRIIARMSRRSERSRGKRKGEMSLRLVRIRTSPSFVRGDQA